MATLKEVKDKTLFFNAHFATTMNDNQELIQQLINLQLSISELDETKLNETDLDQLFTGVNTCLIIMQKLSNQTKGGDNLKQDLETLNRVGKHFSNHQVQNLRKLAVGFLSVGCLVLIAAGVIAALPVGIPAMIAALSTAVASTAVLTVGAGASLYHAKETKTTKAVQAVYEEVQKLREEDSHSLEETNKTPKISPK